MHLTHSFLSLRKRVFSSILLAIGAVSLNGCDEPDLLKDPTFQSWCGDTLCAWTTEHGAVRKVPTWHELDYGIAFVSTGTRISQVVSRPATCLKFTAVGNVDPSAQLTVDLDFNNDGSVDFTYVVPAAQWERFEMDLTAPVHYDTFKFTITKKGGGTAQLAEMRLQDASSCANSPPIALHDLAFARECNADNECTSGICQRMPCVLFGCGTARCAECDPQAATCGDGVQCKTASAITRSANQCDPGNKHGLKGAPCIQNDDCASSLCVGAELGDPAAPSGVQGTPLISAGLCQ